MTFEDRNDAAEVVASGGEPAHLGREIMGPANGPLEGPPETVVAGPYYRDLGEVIPDIDGRDASAQKAETPALAVDRRDFMRLFGAGAVMASTACVRRPVEKAIPYVNQPVDQIPGEATYFASTCNECSAGCGVVVRTREGRAVKVEGSQDHPIAQGASCALGQSTLQALYHPERRKTPFIRRGGVMDETTWDELFLVLGNRLKQTNKIGILTGGSTGHRHEFFREFLKKMGAPESNLYTYESNSLLAAITQAHKIAFGVEAMPNPQLRAAEMILGIGSDFLDVGISPVYTAKGFAQSHTFRFGRMGEFVQFESTMSQTGTRASERHVVPVGSEMLVALMLIKALDANTNARGSAGDRAEIRKVIEANQGLLGPDQYRAVGMDEAGFAALAERLLARKSVIMAGGSTSFNEHATALQLAAIMANTLIGAYGQTLELERNWLVAPVVPGDTQRFLAQATDLDILFVIDSNPVFTMPTSAGVGELLKKIPTVISMQSLSNETDEFASHLVNTHHYLESWGDEQPIAGLYSMRQPVTRPAFNSRQAEEVLMWIAAAAEKPMGHEDYRSYLRLRWQKVLSLVGAKIGFDAFFRYVQRRGFIGAESRQTVGGLRDLVANVKLSGGVATGLTLVAPLDPRLRDGRGASRPVLQEVGDSMTSIAWDTWVALNPNKAKELGFKRGDVLKIEGPGGSYEAALYPVPGLHRDAVVTHRGNGHATGVSKVTDGLGANPLVAFSKAVDALSGEPVTAAQSVKLSSTGKYYQLAAMQKSNSSDIGNRYDIVKTMSLAKATASAEKTVDLDTVPDLYPKLEEGEYRWGMAIDLTACSGCSACMVACATENNVPQVGREQIHMGREMHWIRLDRYFKGDLDNPEVTYQPMLCQHCNHAPCEAVCPVFATTHDAEGLNSQTYNRCVGTRYCANACPYKVRRFNWFTHQWNVIGDKPIHRNPRALNPDVTVRTRGIMEKCTFCYQRIREAKHIAKERSQRVPDGALQTACQQACPSDAIVFGDLKDNRSLVSRMRQDARAYLALGGDPAHGHFGIKTLPNVSYLAKVTVHEDTTDHGGHHG